MIVSHLVRFARTVCIGAMLLALGGSVAPRILAAEDAEAETPRRIESDDAEVFGMNVTRINFEEDPVGKELRVGEDLSVRLAAWGCLLSTSVKDSYVAVQPFNVGGRSGVHCAATHDPIYQGTITIRFCRPGSSSSSSESSPHSSEPSRGGRFDKPAGVHSVGLWVSHVTPNGTTMRAFDKDGREIYSVKTAKDVRDFLGIHSPRPIARVEIVPDAKIDPDYAIDDLTFDRPVLLR